jgi:hypothetical protein
VEFSLRLSPQFVLFQLVDGKAEDRSYKNRSSANALDSVIAHRFL